MPYSNIPDIVIRRLTTYLQSLNHMLDAGETVASSANIGRWASVSAAQVRKDLSYFGEFGRQGLGYEIAFLHDQIERILQTDQDWHFCIVGAGALGHALANYESFARWHFHLEAVFDTDPAKIGAALGGKIVLPLDELATAVRERHIEIGIVAVPASAAQTVVDALVANGIRSVLNYAPITVSVPREVRVRYIDPVASLQTMTYYLQQTPLE